MNDMNDETGAFIPPVILDDYEDFRNFAVQAAIVTYSLDYFRGPFLDDRKRIRRITLAAIGVKLKDVPLSFKFVIEYDDLWDSSRPWEEQVSVVDLRIEELITRLESECTVVRGAIDTVPAMGKALTARP
ncbi:MAG: hypothetical protein ACTSV2_05255 [Candidatus Thorarchaeota archaeon]